MDKLLEKYASVLLNTCLKVEKNQPLFVSFNSERLDFARIVAREAYKIGVKDIYFDVTDSIIKRDALLNLSYDELTKHQYFNKEAWNEYTKKNAAFLMLASETPGLLNDVDQKKLSDITIYAFKSRKVFNDYRNKSNLAWCIAAVPTEAWAKQVFPKSKDPVNDLWNQIFTICHIKENNPKGIWDKKTSDILKKSKKLTSYQFKQLKYTNSLGTNFTVNLPQNHIWQSGYELLANGKRALVNFPTEEVFTSPDCTSANGIVYASKPLSYQDNLIKDFWVKFKNGVAVDCHAEVGEEVLKNIISSCNNSNKLGEVALVPYDSPISNSNLVYYETLFDENASCHIALGDSFPECIKDGLNKTKKELYNNYHLNDCENHVDFMIGTKDLEITGITAKGEEIKIFEKGNFTNLFN